MGVPAPGRAVVLAVREELKDGRERAVAHGHKQVRRNAHAVAHGDEDVFDVVDAVGGLEEVVGQRR
jgi:hypothetical protein